MERLKKALRRYAADLVLVAGAAAVAVGAGLVCAAGAAWAATSLDVDLLHKLFGGFLIVIGLSELFGREKQKP